MNQRSRHPSPSAFRKIALFLLTMLLMAVLLQGCGGIFYSTLTDADIRATAYDIATTRLALTIEVPTQAIQAVSAEAPTATLDPTFCKPEPLSLWTEATLMDIRLLGDEISNLKDGNYTNEQINQTLLRADQRIEELQVEPDPRCALKANRKLSEVYSQLKETVGTQLRGDYERLPDEKLKLRQSIQRFLKAVAEIIHGDDFTPFNDLLSEFQ